MHAASNYVIRMATDEDEDDLARLAAVDSSRPLEGSILVGELDGAPVVALSLDDDRAICDPFSPTGHLLATMRVRARGVRAVAHMPSLRDRLLAGLPTIYRARLTGRAV
jgi:hypothetical protein